MEGVNGGECTNTGSVPGPKGGSPHLLYPSSKGAVVNMSRAMETYNAEVGIRVNCGFLTMPNPSMMYHGGMCKEFREATLRPESPRYRYQPLGTRKLLPFPGWRRSAMDDGSNLAGLYGYHYGWWDGRHLAGTGTV